MACIKNQTIITLELEKLRPCPTLACLDPHPLPTVIWDINIKIKNYIKKKNAAEFFVNTKDRASKKQSKNINKIMSLF